jgi:hypothetical protein
MLQYFFVIFAIAILGMHMAAGQTPSTIKVEFIQVEPSAPICRRRAAKFCKQ